MTTPTTPAPPTLRGDYPGQVPVPPEHVDRLLADLHGFQTIQAAHQHYRRLFPGDKVSVQALGVALYWRRIPKFKGDKGVSTYNFDCVPSRPGVVGG